MPNYSLFIIGVQLTNAITSIHPSGELKFHDAEKDNGIIDQGKLVDPILMLPWQEKSGLQTKRPIQKGATVRAVNNAAMRRVRATVGQAAGEGGADGVHRGIHWVRTRARTEGRLNGS